MGYLAIGFVLITLAIITDAKLTKKRNPESFKKATEANKKEQPLTKSEIAHLFMDLTLIIAFWPFSLLYWFYLLLKDKTFFEFILEDVNPSP